MTKRTVTVSLCAMFSVAAFTWAGRLGDLPQDHSKENARNAEKTNRDTTPEQRKKVVSDLANDYYKRGLEALRANHSGEAKMYFEKVLALSPNHAPARARLSAINNQLAAKRKPTTMPPIEVHVPKQENPQPVKRAPREKPVSPEEMMRRSEKDREESDRLYLEALTASQNKEKANALKLCKQALKLNPSNLQAQRMLERLSQ